MPHFLLQQVSTMQWTELMDHLLSEIPSYTPESLSAALVSIPFPPAYLALFPLLHAAGCELLVVSDANSYFIEAILAHHDCLKYFRKIYTNPARWENGRLRVDKLMQQPHGCARQCAVNICKSVCLRDYLGERGEADRMLFYVGDGSNDYCPASMLSSEDHVFPRKGFDLEFKCLESPPLAQVHVWSTVEEMMEMMKKLL
uniref:Uncharacterized protein n=1 Tax=Arcella intermedia TaxID=1963864 RepID=A0A6B2LH78_9EUKA